MTQGVNYVPGKINKVDSRHSRPFSVSQQADEKKTLLEALTPAQRTNWHMGRNSQLSSDKAASCYLWINTHWAFGTIGLPSWLTTDEPTINSIFQIRSNAVREVMDLAREHLRRENLKLKAEADRILDDIGNTLQPDQAKTSRRLVATASMVGLWRGSSIVDRGFAAARDLFFRRFFLFLLVVGLRFLETVAGSSYKNKDFWTHTSH